MKGTVIIYRSGCMNRNLKKNVEIIGKGFAIGSSMSVPGVSGGTMAILLGIYDRLIGAISNFLKDIKGNTIFLIKFCIGAGLGIGSLAFLIKALLEKFPIPVSFFFLGAVIGGIPALYDKTKEKKISLSSVIYFIIGLVLVISIAYVPTGNVTIGLGGGPMQYLMLLVTGIVIALALVLPGISTSHMLLVLGMYDTMLNAITEFDVIFIALLGISTIIGVFLITKPIEWTMGRFPRQTYFMIIGFVLGSTSEIFQDKIIPAVPDNGSMAWWIGMVIISIITFVLGYFAILSLSKLNNE